MRNWIFILIFSSLLGNMNAHQVQLVTHHEKTNGVLIIGTPSLSSQKHASKYSKKFHVNCFDKDQLDKYLNKYFQVQILRQYNHLLYQ